MTPLGLKSGVDHWLVKEKMDDLGIYDVVFINNPLVASDINMFMLTT
jgi:hypothetical protein